MKKLILPIVALLLCCFVSPASAQVTRRMRSGTSLPGTCISNTQVVDVFVLKSGVPASDGQYWCNAGSWVKDGLSAPTPTMIIGKGGGGTWTVGQFIAITLPTASGATESLQQVLIPYACTCKNFYARWTDTGGTVLTIRKNGVNTSLVVTGNSSGVATTFSNTSNSASFAAGDLISIGVTVATQTSGIGTSLECDKP